MQINLRLDSTLANRWARRFPKQAFARAARAGANADRIHLCRLCPCAGHDGLSSAQTSTGPSKPVAIYAGAVIGFGGLIFAPIRTLTGSFQHAIPGPSGALLSADAHSDGAWATVHCDADIDADQRPFSDSRPLRMRSTPYLTFSPITGPTSSGQRPAKSCPSAGVGGQLPLRSVAPRCRVPRGWSSLQYDADRGDRSVELHPRPPGQAPLLALLPVSGEIRLGLRAGSGNGYECGKEGCDDDCFFLVQKSSQVLHSSWRLKLQP